MHIAQAARLVDCAAEGGGDSSKVDSVAANSDGLAPFVDGCGHSSVGDDD